MLLRTRLSLFALAAVLLTAVVFSALVWQLQERHEAQVGRLLMSSQRLAWERIAGEIAAKEAQQQAQTAGAKLVALDAEKGMKEC